MKNKKNTKTYSVMSDMSGTMSHEFTITQTKGKRKTVTRLFHSEAEVWLAETRGSEILVCTDDGDGYVLDYSCDFAELGYDEAQYLYILFKFLAKREGPFKYKFLEIKKC